MNIQHSTINMDHHTALAWRSPSTKKTKAREARRFFRLCIYFCPTKCPPTNQSPVKKTSLGSYYTYPYGTTKTSHELNSSAMQANAPPRTIFKAGIFDNGEGVLKTPTDAGMRPFSTKYFQSHHFRSESPPYFRGKRV